MSSSEGAIQIQPGQPLSRRPEMEMEGCGDNICCVCCTNKTAVACYTIFLNVLATLQLIHYSTMFLGFPLFIEWIKSLDVAICDNSMKTIEETEVEDDCADKAYIAARSLFTLSVLEMVLCIAIYYYTSRNLNIDMIYGWLILCGLPAAGIPLAHIAFCIVSSWWKHHWTGIVFTLFIFLHLVFKLIGIKIVLQYLTRVRKDHDMT